MEKVCGHDECNNLFTPKSHNQKYCSDTCCRLATNKRIMQRYYENKARRNGAERRCSSCDALLSRYNTDDTCAPCQTREAAKFKQELFA